MANAHQHRDFLLQAFIFGSLVDSFPLSEHFHGIMLTGTLLNTQIYGCKMTLTKLVSKSVLLVKSAGFAIAWVTEDEAYKANDRDFVTLLEITPLISAHNCVIHKGTIAGKILDKGDSVAVRLFHEQESVTV